MQKARFSTVLLILVFTLLAVVSALLLTPAYLGSEKALQHEIQLAYERDQRALDGLLEARFRNIQHISQELIKTHELRDRIQANEYLSVASFLDELLLGPNGQHIDALVVEYNDGAPTVVTNSSMFDIQLPWDQILETYSPPGVWNTVTAEGERKRYSLLRLTLPVVDAQYGEVIGKMHTFVMLNDNYWIISLFQELFGAQAISLHNGAQVLDGLESEDTQLQTLANAEFTDRGVVTNDQSILREHTLNIGGGEQYTVRSLLPNAAYHALQDAYLSNLLVAAIVVAVLGISTMFVILRLTRSSLSYLTRYAEQVPESGSPQSFSGGHFQEFERVGMAVEKMLLRIRDRDKLLSSILDHSPDLIFVKDKGQQYQVVNTRFAEMFNQTPEEVIGQADQAVLSEGLKRLANRSDSQLLESGEPNSYEMDMETSKGELTFLVNKFPIYSDEGDIESIGGIATDITELKNAERRLQRLAHYDSLTGLPNRTLFKQQLKAAIADKKSHITAVMFIDLDHFKNINDTYGHSVGDQLLLQVAGRLRSCVSLEDTVSRLGGDEFTVILRGLKDNLQVETIAHRIVVALRKPYDLGSIRCYTSASIGISIAGKDGNDVDTLTRHADLAMYQAKEKGRDVIQFFDQEINECHQLHHQYEEDLRQAFDRNELFVVFQPRFDITGQHMMSAEALVRWRHPEHGLVPPSDFIPIAEGSNQIVKLGRFVLNEACTQAAAWLAEGYPMSVSVNLSTRQLYDQDLLRDIRNALSDSGLPSRLLELEVTETHMMENIDQFLPLLNEIRGIGVQISVDDFGTGYSSLMYLKKLPVAAVKIDRSFIMDIPGDVDDENLVRAIISMSHSLRLKVVAEGVETEEQRRFLSSLGCDELQGFLLGRPDDVSVLKALADKQTLKSEND
ncbi:EAL domain-containing protein [Pontibacterium granulatum]|uniref:EAL domain-containing protein n=1 Tax=Pontibacterium granulatum TaxID=2036029 RepID=UPI00249BD864|nr:EAL domain-containing protein [Pontibacterium granulatum]MDI3325945.1 EAL domain-containing protein [Pontibacterium granulatum]